MSQRPKGASSRAGVPRCASSVAPSSCRRFSRRCSSRCCSVPAHASTGSRDLHTRPRRDALAALGPPAHPLVPRRSPPAVPPRRRHGGGPDVDCGRRSPAGCRCRGGGRGGRGVARVLTAGGERPSSRPARGHASTCRRRSSSRLRGMHDASIFSRSYIVRQPSRAVSDTPESTADTRRSAGPRRLPW